MLKVNTVTVSKAINNQYRTFNGQVVAAELTPLSFMLKGKISSITVKEGALLKKGQIIATLDDTKPKQALFDAQAKLKLALKRQQRGKELFNKKMISKAEFDSLNTNYKLSKALHGLTQSQFNYTRLRAPYDGIVSVIDKQKFENVVPGERVISLYQNDKVYLQISLSDSMLSVLNPQTNINQYKPIATFAGHPTQYPVSYLEHTSELHPENQTYQLWMSMPQTIPEILPGTSVQVLVDMEKVSAAKSHGFTLPLTAIDSASTRSEFKVWKLIQGHAYNRPITIGKINSQGAVVVSGIETGDVIINSSLSKLREGMQVEVTEYMSEIEGIQQ
ncbi:MAG: efflux RND transporter periplasmic adaptor subunit [Psychromonas sp.]